MNILFPGETGFGFGLRFLLTCGLNSWLNCGWKWLMRSRANDWWSLWPLAWFYKYYRMLEVKFLECLEGLTFILFAYVGLLKPSANDWWSLGWLFYVIRKCNCWKLRLMIDEALVTCYVIFAIFGYIYCVFKMESERGNCIDLTNSSSCVRKFTKKKYSSASIIL